MLVIRLPEEIEERLAKLARKTGRTSNFHAREAILTYIEDLEDLHMAEERLPSPSKRWSHRDPVAEVDLSPGRRRLRG